MSELIPCQHEYAKVDFVAGYCACGMGIQEILARARYGNAWQVATSPIDHIKGEFVYKLPEAPHD